MSDTAEQGHLVDQGFADQGRMPDQKMKAEPERSTAAARLRAFEDEHIGADAIRNNNGHIERGFGSKFKEMSPQQHVEYAALERLVASEAKVDAANAALSIAKSEHDTAVAELDRLSKAPVAADGEAIEAEKAHGLV